MNEGGIKISRLPEKMKGCLLLFGEELDIQVQTYRTSLRESCAVTNIEPLQWLVLKA